MSFYTKNKKDTAPIGSNPIGADSGKTAAAPTGTIGTVTKKQLDDANGFSPNGKNVMAKANGNNVELSGYGTYMGIPRVTKKSFSQGQGYSPNGGEAAATVNGRNVALSGYGTYLADPYEIAVKKIVSEQPAAGVRRNVPYDAASNGYGIRAELVNSGLSDTDIGWDGQWVTYKGQKLIMPTTNINGTAYADKNAIQQAIKQAYAADGVNLVQLNQYADMYGQTGLLGYNPSLKEVTVDGKSTPYAFIDDGGNAWVSESIAKNAFEDAAKRQGIDKPQDYMDRYDDAIKRAENETAAASSRMKNWRMSADELENDAAYQAYKQMYLREAARAYADNLGEAAARNGGNLSSAALAAAGQGQQYYLSQLNDIKPQIYQMAYERFLNGEQANIDAQKQIMQNALNKYDRQYTANRDRISDTAAVRADAYQRMLNDWELKEKKQTYDTNEAQRYQAIAEALGRYTPEGAAYFGVSEDQSPFAGALKYLQGQSDIEERRNINIDNNAHKNNLEVMDKEKENNFAQMGMQQQYDLETLERKSALERLLQSDLNRYDQEQTAQKYNYEGKLAADSAAREAALKLLTADGGAYAEGYFPTSEDDAQSLADVLVESGAIDAKSKDAFVSSIWNWMKKTIPQ